MRIIQLLPTLSFGDAVGNDALAIRKILKEAGYETGIYAENIDPRLPRGTAKPVRELPRLRDEEIILYHGSTGTKLNFDLPKLPGRKVMIYHNITPPRFFEGYSSNAVQLTKYGYEGIRYLSDKIEYCLPVSEFDKQDLLSMGYACPIDVCPILIPFEDYDQAPDPKVLDLYRNDGYTNLLFVGRISPNKKQEDVIAAFCAYHRNYNPKSRLFLVGSSNGMELYERQLKYYAEQLGLSDSVIFPGHIKFNAILSYYRLADVFVCMSEHEGFCVPIVEAMYFDKPIAAYRSTAVPETMAGGGLLLEDKNPHIAAAAIDRIVRDETLRSYISARQRERLKDFSYEAVRKRFLECIENVL